MGAAVRANRVWFLMTNRIICFEFRDECERSQQYGADVADFALDISTGGDSDDFYKCGLAHAEFLSSLVIIIKIINFITVLEINHHAHIFYNSITDILEPTNHHI